MRRSSPRLERGQVSRPEQRDAFRDRGSFEGAIERRERQSFALGELEIGRVVESKMLSASPPHRLVAVRRRHSNREPRELDVKGRALLPRRYAASTLATTRTFRTSK
jgi:hypothetical protein